MKINRDVGSADSSVLFWKKKASPPPTPHCFVKFLKIIHLWQKEKEKKKS